MRKLFFLCVLMLTMLTARAQYGVQVWKDGKYVFFHVANVDSIRFVRLVTDIYLSDEVVELKERETKQLTASVFPVDADDKGLMWSSSNPEVASVDAGGLVTAVGSGTSLITVAATDSSGVKAECQIKVIKAGGDDTVFLTCIDDNHPHAIDLGLPSGTKWCCCNVGASTPEGYGGYYAWGETSEKSYYDYDTYAYGSSWDNCINIGSDIAGTSYDAATVNMGTPWRMPSMAQQTELLNCCSRQWTQQNGINGILVTGPNGGQIFLPAAGHRLYGKLKEASIFGSFWSSSFFPYDYSSAYHLEFGSDYWDLHNGSRRGGETVRAVCP